MKLSIVKACPPAGLESRHIQLSVNVIDSIVEYICNHPALVFVVAVSDDHVARALIEEVIPQRGGRVPVPLVLNEDRQPLRISSALTLEKPCQRMITCHWNRARN